MNSVLILFLLILPPLLFATTNILDVRLMRECDPSVLMVIGALFNALFFLVLFCWCLFIGVEINYGFNFLFLCLNGVLYTGAIWLYLHILQEEEVSKAVPFFQIIPVFGIIGGYIFLGEKLGAMLIVAILLLLLGGLILIYEGGSRIRKKLALGMILSSLFIALNDIILANFGRTMGILPALCGDLLGKVFFGFIFLILKKTRTEFIPTLRIKFKLQALNEIIFVIADMIFDWAKIIAPVALVQGMCSTQPLFLLGIAAFCTKFFPTFHCENFEGINKWRKVIGVLLMVIGGIIVSIK